MRPGIDAGLASVLAEGFGVRLKPTEADAAAVAAIERKISASGISCDALRLSDAPVQRGSLFDAVGRRVEFPRPEDSRYDRCIVALVDPERTARWGHAAWFAFYPADGSGPVELVATDMPEHSAGGVRLEYLGDPK